MEVIEMEQSVLEALNFFPSILDPIYAELRKQDDKNLGRMFIGETGGILEITEKV